MAGGKLSPRQKMINLMYLVFIAMLATQMDKQVLSAFGFIKEKVEETSISVEGNIRNTLTNLERKAQEQPDKFGDENAKAVRISKLSDDFFKFLKSVKDSILANVEEEDRNNYESMSGGDRLDELFFTGEGFTEFGKTFEQSIIKYKTDVLSVLGAEINSATKSNIENRFDTDEIPGKEGEGPQKWLRKRYEGMPMITSLANITQIQGDVRMTEAEIYNGFLRGQMTEDASLTNYNGIVALDKNAFYPGEKITGKIVLGRYDPTLRPKSVKLNGRDYKNFKDGEVLLDFRAGNVGEKDIKGTITFIEDGEEIPVPFKSMYSVIPKPNKAVVSADKMNVVYRGLDNPISVSLPGVPDNKIRVTASNGNLSGSKGKFILNPGKGEKSIITVRATLDDNTSVKSDREFRIKDIPAAAGTVRGDFGVVPMPKSSLNNTPINVELPDFVFELEFVVKSFTVKVPGQLAVKVNGNKFDARAKKILAKAKRGDVITIFDIKANEKKKGVPLKKVLPVSIQITN